MSWPEAVTIIVIVAAFALVLIAFAACEAISCYSHAMCA